MFRLINNKYNSQNTVWIALLQVGIPLKALTPIKLKQSIRTQKPEETRNKSNENRYR